MPELPLRVIAAPMEVALGATPARPRKLHLGHFVFMRALVQGLNTQVA